MAFNSVTKTFSHGKDSIAVRNYLGGVAGGVFLDTTGWPEDQKTIPALTIIVRDTTTGVAKPLPISEGVYEAATAPEGTEIIGLTVATVMADEPSVGVINAGEVNDLCLPFINGKEAAIKAAIKAALPTLILTHD